MFNAEIKEKYLETQPNSQKPVTKNIFVATKDYENKYGKDVAEFSASELSDFLEGCGFAEPNTIRTRTTTLISYAEWYMSNIKSGSHKLRDYKITDFPYARLFEPLLIKTPDELINKIRQVYDLDSGQPVVAALCFAWIGVSSKEALNLRNEQVDVTTGTIFDQKGNISVRSMPDCIRDTLAIYSKTKTADRTQNRTFKVYADDIGLFIKRFSVLDSKQRGKPITQVQLSSAILEFNNQYNSLLGTKLSISYTNVQRSGSLYRLYQLDKQGIDVHSVKNADKVRMCLGQSKRNHKDNMLLYDAYLECIGEK